MNAAIHLPPAEAARFLYAIDPTATAWTFQTFDDSPEKRGALARTLHGTLAEHAAELARLNAAGAGVFITPNETNGTGRKAENITRVRAVFADFDNPPPGILERLRAGPLPPSILVESSAGKWHAYWLADGVTLGEFKPLQQALARHWGSDPAVCDLPRVMRLPGFTHRKGEPQPVKLLEAPGHRYNRAELLERYPLAPQPTPKPASVVAPSFTDKTTQYGAAALASACATITATVEGARNATLNAEAFGIGRLVAGGEIEAEEALRTLGDAAERTGLEAGEITPTLNSAFLSGLAKPRAAGADPARAFATAPELPPGASEQPTGEVVMQAPRPLLPDEPTPSAAYPVEALPPVMRAAALAIAEHVQAPLALAAQCVIGAAAHLAQTRINAPHIHKQEGMPASLFMLTLADSGDRKSECRRLAFRVVDDAEREARTTHRQACAVIEAEAAQYKGKKREEHLDANPLPPDPRTQYSDATFEPIAGDMIRGTAAASWDTDEGGQMLGGASLKADTRTATIGGLCRAFDTGDFERTRSRANLEGSGFAYSRRLSVHLLAQSVAVAEALRDPLLRGQGFLPRFLFAAPVSLAGTRLLTAEQMGRRSWADPRLQAYWERCRAIQASPGHINRDTSEVRPPVLALTAEGEAEWLAFYNEVEGEQGALGQYAGLRPFAGRAGELARRVAAVLAFFEGRDRIDGEAMRNACAIVRHSLEEWLRYTDRATVDPDRQQAAKLLEWLGEKGWREFEARALQREGPSCVRKSAQRRDKLLAILAEHGHLITSDRKQFRLVTVATTATTATSQ